MSLHTDETAKLLNRLFVLILGSQLFNAVVETLDLIAQVGVGQQLLIEDLLLQAIRFQAL